ncbi:MAG: LemA family protein [Deltaproteobacteria bacterium]|nr:LemA family protein [Deltaproteobacteria bacterium]
MSEINKTILKTLIGDASSKVPFNLRVVYAFLAALVFVMLVWYLVYVNNLFTRLIQDVLSTRSGVYSAVQMRTNLLPVFINSVASFKGHEKNLFLETTKLRSGKSKGAEAEKTGVNDLLKKIGKAKHLGQVDAYSKGILDKIAAVAENYPDLKSSEPFMLLMSKMSDAELAVYEARVKYNTAVNAFNKAVTTFPNSLLAPLFGFPREPYFETVMAPEWEHPTAATLNGEQ